VEEVTLEPASYQVGADPGRDPLRTVVGEHRPHTGTEAEVTVGDAPTSPLAANY
jgi:hypothetical protein